MKIIEFLNGQVIASIISGIVAIVALTTKNRRSLDLESDWRKKLFKAASLEEITMEEVQLLRTALRYGKVDDEKAKIFSFFWFTNLAIDFCDHLRDNKKQWKNGKYLLTEEEQEVIRIFIRCLLKHNWEVNQTLKPKLLKRKIYETKYIKESYEKAYEEYNIMQNGTFDFKIYTVNKAKKATDKSDRCSITQVFQIASFIAILILLAVRVLFEMGKIESNISNSTIGFFFVISIMFSFLKELEQ